jgi:DNA polymerase III sliding clamp (beta) subunit (PCNA family)
MTTRVSLAKAQHAAKLLGPALTGPAADGRVRVVSREGVLVMSACGPDAVLSVDVPADVGVEIDELVVGRLLVDFIATAVGTDLVFTVAEKLFVHAGGGELDLPLIPVDSWLAIEHVESFPTTWPPNAPELLMRVAHAADPDSPGALGGIALQSGMAVATDKYRISAVELPLEMPDDIVVPAAAMIALERLHDGFSPIEVRSTPSKMTFSGPGWTSTSNLIDDGFPDWRSQFPDSASPALVAYRDQLLEALRRIKLVAGKDHLKKIQIETYNPELLRIWADIPDVGRQEDLVEGTLQLPPISFNLDNLTRAVQHLHRDSVEIEMAGVLSPAILRGDGYLALVMPIRV